MKCDLCTKEGSRSNNKLSTSYSSTQAPKEDISKGGNGCHWQRRWCYESLVPWLDCYWYIIFFLCFPYGNILQKKLTILINMFPVVVPLFKGLSLFSYRVYHSSSVPPIPLLLELSLVSIGSCSDSVYKPLAYLLKSSKKSSNSNPICATLFNLGMTDVSG